MAAFICEWGLAGTLSLKRGYRSTFTRVIPAGHRKGEFREQSLAPAQRKVDLTKLLTPSDRF